jgi:hypothetical protein
LKSAGKEEMRAAAAKLPDGRTIMLVMPKIEEPDSKP